MQYDSDRARRQDAVMLKLGAIVFIAMGTVGLVGFLATIGVTQEYAPIGAPLMSALMDTLGWDSPDRRFHIAA